VDGLGGGLDELPGGAGVALDEPLGEHVRARGEVAEQVDVAEQRPDAAPLHRLVPQHAAEHGDVELPLAQALLQVDRRHDDRLDLLDLRRGQAAAGEVLLQHGLGVGAEGVHADLLADQVPRAADRAVVRYVEALVDVLVAAVVADHRLDRGLGGDQLDDGAVEGAAEVGLPGGRGLDVLGAADGVADPPELDGGEVAEVLGQLREGDGADAALVAQLLRLRGALGGATGRNSE
jgi:hypothetical protein